MKKVLTVVGVVALLVACLTAWIGIRYRGGTPYPDLSTEPSISDELLEKVVISDEPIGNVAVSADERIFYTIHPESRPTGPQLLEWVDGAPKPYPSEAAQDTFVAAMGLIVDQQNRLWVMDHGLHAVEGARVIAFDLSSNEEVHRFVFPKDVAPSGAFLQDLQITSDGAWIFIADASFVRQDPGIVVYDVTNRKSWRRLSSHPSTSAQRWLVRTPTKDMKFLGGLVNFNVGIDGIGIDREDEWVYYGALNHDTLYRVSVDALRDPNGDVEAAVEAVGKKPLNDGLSVDLNGDILITDIEHQGVALMRQESGELETLIKSDKIRWADALSYGSGNNVYIADSAIPDQVMQSKQHMVEEAPYFVWRFPAPAGGIAGQ